MAKTLIVYCTPFLKFPPKSTLKGSFIFFWREISNPHLVTAMADREEAKPIAVVFFRYIVQKVHTLTKDEVFSNLSLFLLNIGASCICYI